MNRRRIDDRAASPPPARSQSRWRSRGVLLLLGVALWLMGILAYAGAGWAAAIYLLIVDGGVLHLWLAAALGIGSLLLSVFRAFDSRAERSLFYFVSAAALGIGAMSLIALGLGLAGWLNQATSWALLAIGIAIGIIQLARVRWTPDSLRPWLAAPMCWQWFGLVAVPFTSLMTAGAMLPPGLLWTPEEPHGYDVVEYHLQVPREWYEAGRVVPLHHNVFSFFPFNVEMQYLLAMHLRGGPWSGMYLAQFMHGAMIALTALAVCAIAAEHATGEGRGLAAPALALVAMAATPWLAQLGAIAYDEGGFLLSATLAMGFSMRAVGESDRPLRWFFLAGVFAGLSCGSKLTAVPEVLIAIPVACALALVMSYRALRRGDDVARASRPCSATTAMTGLALFLIAGVLIFAPWLIRTAVWSHGNPIFPELPRLLGRGDFSDVQIERWKHAHEPRPDQQSLSARLRAGWVEVLAGWQFGFLLIPAALASIALGWRSVQVRFLAAMLFLLAVFWLFFTHLQGRFFVLAIPICALLVARLSWRAAAPVVVIQAAIAVVLLNLHFFSYSRGAILSVVLGTEDLSWLTPAAIKSVPKDAHLELVGDARAFVYQRPMSRLSYRTVFDADTSGGRGIIDAFAGPPTAGEQWLLIDPLELERFARTYQPFPAVGPEIASHREPFINRR